MQKRNTSVVSGISPPRAQSSGLIWVRVNSLPRLFVFVLLFCSTALGDTESLSGKVLDPQEAAVAGAKITLLSAAGSKIAEAITDAAGAFMFAGFEPGVYQLTAESPAFIPVTASVSIASGQTQEMTLKFQQILAAQQQLTVVASAPSILTPDPAQTIFVHDQLLDANPGRPGAPISLPGLPIETASGGVKAPQYFAPGVAGGHGEPIAQYFQIGEFLYPNNLPANAHGNGYSDPNFLIPPVIEAVTGVRQEEVWMDNEDLLHPQNSFDKLATLTLPKGTLTVLPPDRWYLPIVAFSYGYGFHTEDPRIGNGSGVPTLLAPSRAEQLVLSKVLKQTQFYLTLRRTSNSQELAKIDPDTGLQEIVGSSVNKVISISAQRNFLLGSIYLSYAQADARDAQTGEPIPEAPRFIWDSVGSLNRLPLRLQFRGEYEYVRAKPLGHGFVGEPVHEFRGAVLRPFLEDRMSIAADFLIASGYTGQTTEVLSYPAEMAATEQIVGVPLKSYISASWTYYFKK